MAARMTAAFFGHNLQHKVDVCIYYRCPWKQFLACL